MTAIFLGYLGTGRLWLESKYPFAASFSFKSSNCRARLPLPAGATPLGNDLKDSAFGVDSYGPGDDDISPSLSFLTA